MIHDILAALRLLTILPAGGSAAGRQPGWAFAWFPLVGLGIGLCLQQIMAAPLAGDVGAFFALLFWVLITGGLHLDGFGDCCDALLAHKPGPERQRILKDPRAGTWAVAGLCLLLLGKWLALQAAPLELLLLAPVMGRWAMALAARALPSASSSGLGAHFRRGLGWRQLLFATLSVGLLMTKVEFLALWLLIFVFTLAFGAWAARQLGGGLNGDVYGAICELSELICLMALGVAYG